MTKWMGMAWLLGMVLAGAARADSTLAPTSPASGTAALESLDLDLTCLLPTNGPAVARGLLVVRLHEYDPRKADGAAREVGRVMLSGVAHRPGSETVLRFPCAATVPERKAYYLTAVLYAEDAPADSAGLYYLVGFRRVLAGGNRESLSVTLTPVGGEGEPSN